MSTKHTFKKEQLEAIDSVRVWIDELLDKPWRLFNALKDFAIAFPKVSGDEEYTQQIIQTFDDASKAYIDRKRKGHSLGNRMQLLVDAKKELELEMKIKLSKSQGTQEYWRAYEHGLDNAFKAAEKKMLEDYQDEY